MKKFTLLVIDVQKGITDERLYNFSTFVSNVKKVIDASIKSAFERGYKVIVPLGANSTFDNEYMNGETTYKYYNEMMWPDRFAQCISVDETIKLMHTN